MAENKNLELWNKVKAVPDAAQTPIRAGRLKGMTDISPQWRYLIMTEIYGPCGIGWYFTVDEKWTEQGADGVVCVFVNISMYIKDGGEWSKPIPGTGGSTLVAKEKAGLYTSDEAFKMATTDAFSVACKALGVGADIYFGGRDSKYFTSQDAQQMTETQKMTAKFKSLLEMKSSKDDLDMVMLDINDVKDTLSEKQFDYLADIYNRKIQSLS